MSDFMETLNKDEDFAQKFQECENAEARRAFLREAGYDVKDARAFMAYLKEHVEFSEELMAMKTMDEKLTSIARAGFFFSKSELDAEQERLEEEAFENVVGGFGLYVEGNSGVLCGSGFWKDETGCNDYLKHIWC